jgi:hypothetical protein
VRRALVATRRLREAADLRVHGVAEAEPLVAQLVDELRLGRIRGGVDVTDGLEKAERQQRVDGG